LIATTGVTSRSPDIIDEHYYRGPESFENDVHHYDTYKRTGPKIFVGEWASQEGFPTPNLHAALGDAAWLIGLERNSDIVILESYAPLLVNINPGASQWPTNLIGYDALQSYGSPSFYVQVMFRKHRGDIVLPTTLTSTGGSKVYASVTRDSRDGTIYLKVVNAAADPQPLHVNLNGVGEVSHAGTAVILTSTTPSASNKPGDTAKAVPVTERVHSLGRSFDYQFAPFSVTVLQIESGNEHHGD
jgi:alpha-N-arabinofuranosidase